MGRTKKTDRIHGPYENRSGWRVIIVGSDGERSSRCFETKAQAEAEIRRARLALEAAAGRSVGEAMEDYEKHLGEKGNRATSIARTLWSIRQIFPDEDQALRALTPKICTELYEEARTRPTRFAKPPSADSHRNALAEAKTFLRWCLEQRWITSSPLEQVKSRGAPRKRGKTQLRIDEVRKWDTVAIRHADAGAAGAVAALLTLYLDLRCSEVVTRTVRDLDDDGRLLWIPSSKTDAGRRTLEVPEFLRPYLRRLAEDKLPGALLFGEHWRDWPRIWVQRICREAEVPVVTAHGMRGLHASLAVQHGATGAVVAAAMGHTSESVTFGAYVSQEAAASAKQGRVLQVVRGGKS
jgi:integrase